MKNTAIKKATKLLKALGNEKRLEVVSYLMKQEMKVGALEKLVGLSQSALSQHLAILRECKVVKTRRDAQSVYYSLNSDNTRQVVELLISMYGNMCK